jgi:hypothetical protein
MECQMSENIVRKPIVIRVISQYSNHFLAFA